MNFFKNKFLLWWQIGILKLSVFSIGIGAGVYWIDFFLPYINWIITIGFVLALIFIFIWFKDDKKAKNDERSV